MFAPPPLPTAGSGSNSLKSVQDPSQLDPTLPVPLTPCHIPTGILIVVMLLKGLLFAGLSWLTHMILYQRDPCCRSLWSIHLAASYVPGHRCGVFQGSSIVDFHGVFIQSLCEGQGAEEGREQMGLFLCSRSFPKQIHFIWLLGHMLPDTLLHEVEDIAAK